MKHFALWCVVTLFLPITLHAKSCMTDVVVDTKTQQIHWILHFPKGSNGLTLPTLQEGDTTFSWTVDGERARLTSGQLTLSAPNTTTVTLQSKIPAASIRRDRVYPPLIRFSDGTIALYAPYFLGGDRKTSTDCIGFTAAGPDDFIYGGGKSHVRSLGLSAAFAGYLAFGKPLTNIHDGVLYVYDRSLPKWAKAKIDEISHSALDYYREKLGNVTVPTVFAFWNSAGSMQPYHWGDRLPDSITLGLYGSGWEVSSADRVAEIENFLDHELFHIWNSIPTPRENKNTLLAVEGGAELVKAILLDSRMKNSGGLLSSVTDALNACELDLPDSSALDATLNTASPGRVPYSCGMVYMFALSSVSGRETADVANAFFQIWRTAMVSHRDIPYALDDLISPNTNSQLLDNLHQALRTSDNFVPSMRKVLIAEGYAVTPVAGTPQLRWRLASKILMNLMEQDCQGDVSFWTTPMGFQLDQHLPRCKSLKANGVVTTILGVTPWENPIALNDRLRSLCKKGATVSVGYSSNLPPSQVYCKGTIPSLLLPLRIQ